MRIGGSGVLAVFVAAVVVWLIGFLIYGLVFSDLWLGLQGLTKETAATEFAGAEWRMALSPIMPIVIAAGVALVMGWRGASGLMGGVTTGFLVALFFLVAGRLYTFVYSAESPGLFFMDSAHLLLNGVAAGAVLGAWPKPKVA